MKNDIIFLKVLRIFGNPTAFDLNFDEVDFDSKSSIQLRDRELTIPAYSSIVLK